MAKPMSSSVTSSAFTHRDGTGGCAAPDATGLVVGCVVVAASCCGAVAGGVASATPFCSGGDAPAAAVSGSDAGDAVDGSGVACGVSGAAATWLRGAGAGAGAVEVAPVVGPPDGT